MRVGDFAVEVVAHGGGQVRELESGHVLARPGQVYRVRLRNLGPLYCVVDLDIDGQRITAGGLVLAPWKTTELERPIDDAERGRFTVVAEGNEAVFGPDGGRDNPALGLIEARFRRELPRREYHVEADPVLGIPNGRRGGRPAPLPPVRPLPSRHPMNPMAPPEWTPPLPFDRFGVMSASPVSSIDFMSVDVPAHLAPPGYDRVREIERAAGTGLTGRSDQEFVPMSLGPLEAEATVIQLRLVIGSEAAIADEPTRPLVEHQTPARPAARP